MKIFRQTLKQMSVNLPEGSELPADVAYTEYLLEEMILDNNIQLSATEKSNSKKQHNPCTEYLMSIHLSI